MADLLSAFRASNSTRSAAVASSSLSVSSPYSSSLRCASLGEAVFYREESKVSPMFSSKLVLWRTGALMGHSNPVFLACQVRCCNAFRVSGDHKAKASLRTKRSPFVLCSLQQHRQNVKPYSVEFFSSGTALDVQEPSITGTKVNTWKKLTKQVTDTNSKAITQSQSDRAALEKCEAERAEKEKIRTGVVKRMREEVTTGDSLLEGNANKFCHPIRINVLSQQSHDSLRISKLIVDSREETQVNDTVQTPGGEKSTLLKLPTDKTWDFSHLISHGVAEDVTVLKPSPMNTTVSNRESKTKAAPQHSFNFNKADTKKNVRKGSVSKATTAVQPTFEDKILESKEHVTSNLSHLSKEATSNIPNDVEKHAMTESTPIVDACDVVVPAPDDNMLVKKNRSSKPGTQNTKAIPKRRVEFNVPCDEQMTSESNPLGKKVNRQPLKTNAPVTTVQGRFDESILSGKNSRSQNRKAIPKPSAEMEETREKSIVSESRFQRKKQTSQSSKKNAAVNIPVSSTASMGNLKKASASNSFSVEMASVKKNKSIKSQTQKKKADSGQKATKSRSDGKQETLGSLPSEKEMTSTTSKQGPSLPVSTSFKVEMTSMENSKNTFVSEIASVEMLSVKKNKLLKSQTPKEKAFSGKKATKCISDSDQENLESIPSEKEMTRTTCKPGSSLPVSSPGSKVEMRSFKKNKSLKSQTQKKTAASGQKEGEHLSNTEQAEIESVLSEKEMTLTTINQGPSLPVLSPSFTNKLEQSALSSSMNVSPEATVNVKASEECQNLEHPEHLERGELQYVSLISKPEDDGSSYVDLEGANYVKERLARLYQEVMIIDDVETAKWAVNKLTVEYRDFIHACDTEVADIDVKKESPVGHGRIVCFSIYCEDENGNVAIFKDGTSCLWVDVLDGDSGILQEFSRYFKDSTIRKVWHNYSFDKHILQNGKMEVDGFYADTMHLARLWNSNKRCDGGYSLESLTQDEKLMQSPQDELISGKVSMKTIFGKKKIKKDGTVGKIATVAPVVELQRTERVPWICYSALDAKSTFKLWKRLVRVLKQTRWKTEVHKETVNHFKSMYDFYEEYWRPFGDLLIQMERQGMKVDVSYLEGIEKVAVKEQEISAARFREWASKYCSDAKFMNVSSDSQVRQLLFGGVQNSKDPLEIFPVERNFKALNVDNIIEEGKKIPTKYRNITLRVLKNPLKVDTFTPSGWPAVSRNALKSLAGKVPVDYEKLDDENENEIPDLDGDLAHLTSEGLKVGDKITTAEAEIDLSMYGTAYEAFGGGEEGRNACHAIAALCEVSAINTLLSGFIQPLQGKAFSDPVTERVHCSLNINTETGRLSARKPNLQNQPALEKDRYKIRQAFIAEPGKSLIVADYGQLELRILAHLSNCQSMLNAFKAGGDFHSRTAMNMYPHVREAVESGRVLLEWYPAPGEEKPPLPLLKDIFAAERRKAKMLNFSIAYGKTAIGLSRDWKVTVEEAQETVDLWYNDRKEVLKWQKCQMQQASKNNCVYTLLGRPRHFPTFSACNRCLQNHILRAAINTPVQGSAADVAMCAMLKINGNKALKGLGWKLILQVHDEVILEGPTESAEEAKAVVIQCMQKPFKKNKFLKVELAVDAKYASNWYAAK